MNTPAAATPPSMTTALAAVDMDAKRFRVGGSTTLTTAAIAVEPAAAAEPSIPSAALADTTVAPEAATALATTLASPPTAKVHDRPL